MNIRLTKGLLKIFALTEERCGKRQSIWIRKSYFLLFFFPKGWAYWFISSGEAMECQHNIVSYRKKVTDNISFMEWQCNLPALVCIFMHRKHEKMLLTSSKQTLSNFISQQSTDGWRHTLDHCYSFICLGRLSQLTSQKVSLGTPNEHAKKN